MRPGMMYVQHMARILFVLALLVSLTGLARAAQPPCIDVEGARGGAEVCCADASQPGSPGDPLPCSDCSCCTHSARTFLAPPLAPPTPLPVACDSVPLGVARVLAVAPPDVFHVPKSR
jgi:hypothetical protein